MTNLDKSQCPTVSINTIFPDDQKLDLLEYARYVLREGTITAKRNLITGLNLNLYLHNKEIQTEKH